MSTNLALIAHDLKNALGVLECELAAMIDNPTPVGAETAHLHCADLRRQFTQFLTLYSAESGQLRALCEDESPLDLLHYLQQVWQLKAYAEGRHLTVSVEAEAAAPPFWYFDRRLVQLALDAALHNAMRFAQHAVRLSVQSESGWLVWRITDDGPGFDATDPDAAHATGLGTALSRAVAEAHRTGDRQGSIALTRDEAGGGTQFSLTLP